MKVVEAAQRPVPVISGRCRSVRLLHSAAAQLPRTRLKLARPGMIISVSVSMFDHEPERCPFGHSLWPGMTQVGWQPCLCTVARETAERAAAKGTSGCHVTPVTTSSGRRRSTSRRMTSTITNPVRGNQGQHLVCRIKHSEPI